MWFIFGFVVCFVLCAICSLTMNYRAEQAYAARDYSHVWPAESPETTPEWLRHAYGRTIGGFKIIAAADPHNASAMTYPASGGQMMWWYDDRDHDGRVDSVSVFDQKRHSFQFQVTNGNLTSYDFTPDVASFEGTSFYDYDLDGAFDFKVTTGPKHASWLMVDSQWCQLVPEGNSRGRVDVNGESRRANYLDHQWRLEE